MQNKHNNKLLNGMHIKLKSKAPYLQGNGLRQSRVIQGQPYYTVETRAYGNVMCYIEKGMERHEKAIKDVIKQISFFQYDARMMGYFFCLFSFGWEDSLLHHNKRGLYIRIEAKASVIAAELCALSGGEPSVSPPVLPSLFPRPSLYSNIMRVRQDDLPVFFCTNRSVRFHGSLRRSYAAVRRHSLWVFLDGETPEWEFGFKPVFLEEEQ